MNNAQPRIAIFTHDTFGLGHVRRCLHIIQGLSEQAPDAAILFVTGSPVVHAMQSLPSNADYIKVPTLVKTGSQGSQPPHLPIPLPEIQLIRERVIQNAIHAFQPDLFLVDNFPLGAQRELLPVLQALKHTSAKAVLGLRDIVDAPEVVCSEWKRQGIYDVLARYYDSILVYGMKEVLDIADAYKLPPQIAGKVHYCGYVTEQPSQLRAPAEIKAELGIKGPLILATGGGGGDAFPLLQTFLSALRFVPKEFSALVFTGPLMGKADRKALKAQVNGRSGIFIRDFEKDLRNYLAAADVVVSMCGYNMAAEILAQKACAIVVPRTWRYGEHAVGVQAGEEWEQIMRARALAKLGLVDLLEPDQLKPKLLAKRIVAALGRPKAKSKSKSAVNMQGLEQTVNHLLSVTS